MSIIKNFHSGPIHGRITDADGSRQTPHPSSVRMGIHVVQPSPSIIRTDGYRWLEPPIRRQRRTPPSPFPSVRVTDALVVRTDGYPTTKKASVRPFTSVKMSETAAVGGQDDDNDILGFLGDGFKDRDVNLSLLVSCNPQLLIGGRGRVGVMMYANEKSLKNM